MLTRSAARRYRRRDLGLAQPLSPTTASSCSGPTATSCPTTIERAIERPHGQRATEPRAPPAELGRAKRLDDAGGRYIEFVKQSFPKGLRLDGLQDRRRLRPWRRLQGRPDGVLGTRRRGVRRSACRPTGSTSTAIAARPRPSRCASRCWRTRADIGIALDGDADRLIVADEQRRSSRRRPADGADRATWRAAGGSQGGGWSPRSCPISGSSAASAGTGLALHRTAVGDRYVVEKMRAGGCNLGGEQSGPHHPHRLSRRPATA